MNLRRLLKVSHERYMGCECGSSRCDFIIESDDMLKAVYVCEYCVIRGCNEVNDYEDRITDPFEDRRKD